MYLFIGLYMVYGVVFGLGSSVQQLVGDGDGVVVVPFARIDQVIERLARVRELEAELDAKVADGLAMPANIAALLAGERIKEIE